MQEDLPQYSQRAGEVFVHGIAIKPGKPAILARIGNVPVIGIPGYPVSAYIVFEEFVTPLLMKMSHRENAQRCYRGAVNKKDSIISKASGVCEGKGRER